MERFRILLVDDSPNVLRSLERSLKGKGYDIFTALSGQDAMYTLQQNDIDLIISDERMPGVVGSDLLKAVKMKYPKVIRILLTGSTDVETIKNAVNKGEVFRFFTKPWDDFELSIAVRQGLQQRALELMNAKLLEFIKKRGDMIRQLEEEYPNISQNEPVKM